jgi:hypothetical protein
MGAVQGNFIELASEAVKKMDLDKSIANKAAADKEAADKLIADKAIADKTAALKAEADAKIARDNKYFDAVQAKKDSIAAKKEAAAQEPAIAKKPKFDWNAQEIAPSIDGVATGQAFLKPNYIKMKKGGSVKSKPKEKVSTASKRGDGCAIRGKTKGRFV